MITQNADALNALNKLDSDQSMRVVQHFRRAVRARQLQWDHERSIEKILTAAVGEDVEIDVDMEELASSVSNPETLSLNDLQEALQ